LRKRRGTLGQICGRPHAERELGELRRLERRGATSIQRRAPLNARPDHEHCQATPSAVSTSPARAGQTTVVERDATSSSAHDEPRRRPASSGTTWDLCARERPEPTWRCTPSPGRDRHGSEHESAIRLALSCRPRFPASVAWKVYSATSAPAVSSAQDPMSYLKSRASTRYRVLRS